MDGATRPPAISAPGGILRRMSRRGESCGSATKAPLKSAVCLLISGTQTDHRGHPAQTGGQWRPRARLAAGIGIERKDPPALSANAKPIKLANPDSLEGMVIPVNMEPRNFMVRMITATPKNSSHEARNADVANEINAKNGVDSSSGSRASRRSP